MFNPNEWKPGEAGSVVAGSDVVCAGASSGDRSLILAAPKMYEFLAEMAQEEGEAAEYAQRLVALADGSQGVLLPFNGNFEAGIGRCEDCEYDSV